MPILRRASGGGTVLIGPGCLCFSLVLAYDSAPGLDEIRASNRYVLGRVASALGPVAAATFEGDERPRGERREVLGQCTAAEAAPLPSPRHAAVRLRHLPAREVPSSHPERQPDYRRNRPHAEFVDESSYNTPRQLKRLLVAEWHAEGNYEPVPWETMRELVAEKYSRDRVEPATLTRHSQSLSVVLARTGSSIADLVVEHPTGAYRVGSGIRPLRAPSLLPEDIP